MPKPVVQIMAGVSGVGKTYMREKLWPHEYVIDMGIIRIEHPGEAWHSMFFDIFLPEIHGLLHDNEAEFIVVEGYFLPGTPSLKLLLEHLKVEGATPSYWFMWAPLLVCEDRINKQFQSGEISADLCSSRVKALHRCWTKL